MAIKLLSKVTLFVLKKKLLPVLSLKDCFSASKTIDTLQCDMTNCLLAAVMIKI